VLTSKGESVITAWPAGGVVEVGAVWAQREAPARKAASAAVRVGRERGEWVGDFMLEGMQVRMGARQCGNEADEGVRAPGGAIRS
jgi:hypothetical protein